MKIFGKDLFGYKKPAIPMYDFAQHGLLNKREAFDVNEYITMENVLSPRETKKGKEKPSVRPKDLFKMESLNHKFTINVDEKYVATQIEVAKEKLVLLGERKKRKKSDTPFFIGGNDSGATEYGRQELESIIERMQNRRKIKMAEGILDRYPHTTSKLINDVVSAHANLRCELAAQFVPDFPREAVQAMKEYNEMCTVLGGKKSVFYVIADKKDFEKTPGRRDPILLGQSPFGFFWQILGAWDEEMIFLGDL